MGKILVYDNTATSAVDPLAAGVNLFTGVLPPSKDSKYIKVACQVAVQETTNSDAAALTFTVRVGGTSATAGGVTEAFIHTTAGVANRRQITLTCALEGCNAGGTYSVRVASVTDEGAGHTPVIGMNLIIEASD